LITQLPTETNVTVVPETVQTDVDPEVNATVNPDEDVPLTETVPALNWVVLGAVKVIVCDAVLKVKVKFELVAER
jgi:hypothetical protein